MDIHKERFVQEAMLIAGDRTQSIFQQRNDFRELVENVMEYQKEKTAEALREQNKKNIDEELRKMPPL